MSVRWTNPKERRGWGETTRPGLFIATVCVSLAVALICLNGYWQATTPDPTPTPEATQTPYVLTIHRTEWVVVTETPTPTRYTPLTYRQAQEAGIAPTFPPTQTPTPLPTATSEPADAWREWRPNIGGS